MGAEDLTLIESLVAHNDPEALRAGHDYQQLAMDRERLASNRLRFANRFQQSGLIPLKVTAMQEHPAKHEQPPFF